MYDCLVWKCDLRKNIAEHFQYVNANAAWCCTASFVRRNSTVEIFLSAAPQTASISTNFSVTFRPDRLRIGGVFNATVQLIHASAIGRYRRSKQEIIDTLKRDTSFLYVYFRLRTAQCLLKRKYGYGYLG